MIAAAHVIRRFWRYTKGNRHTLVLGGVCAILISGSELGAVIVFSMITDRVLARGHLAAFWPLVCWWLGIVAVAAVMMFVGNYATSLASERFALRLRDDIFGHAQRMPPDFFDKRHLGDLMVRLVEDVAVIEGTASSGAISAATSAMSVALFSSAAFVISWRLTLVACAVAPVFWLASRGFSGKMRRAAQRERETTGKLMNVVEERLSNQALIQAYNRQADEHLRLHAEGHARLRATMMEVRLSAIYGPATYVIETLCVLTAFGFGAWQLTRGTITLGGLLAFTILLAYLYPPVQGVTGYPLSVAEASESVARVTEILDARSPVCDGTVVVSRHESLGTVIFENVSFAYPESGRQVLRGMSFRAEPGETVAIVGPSGSGKSTIAKLLLRFYDPDAGRVLFDGLDIRELSLQSLRCNITLLQQDSLLFSGSIAENIGYGKDGATPAEIVAAARAAGAHEFISALPDGYDAPVGQRGRLLSGGQRKRIAIARATLRDAPVLVLDEPTAGLSPADSWLVMRLLEPVVKGRTTIVITHDTSVAAGADRVIRLVPVTHAVPVHEDLGSPETRPDERPTMVLSPGNASYHRDSTHHNSMPNGKHRAMPNGKHRARLQVRPGQTSRRGSLRLQRRGHDLLASRVAPRHRREHHIGLPVARHLRLRDLDRFVIAGQGSEGDAGTPAVGRHDDDRDDHLHPRRAGETCGAHGGTRRRGDDLHVLARNQVAVAGRPAASIDQHRVRGEPVDHPLEVLIGADGRTGREADRRGGHGGPGEREHEHDPGGGRGCRTGTAADEGRKHGLPP
jgi:ATP-binding cassette, subfamily B, bacterial